MSVPKVGQKPPNPVNFSPQKVAIFTCVAVLSRLAFKFKNWIMSEIRQITRGH